MRYGRVFVCLCVYGAVLTACATQPSPQDFNPPGFWLGLLHGAIAPFALIGSLFTDVRIYAFLTAGGGMILDFC
jgi:hypothetical protein